MTNFQNVLTQTIAAKKGKKNGFTLIELMVVVAIVGVLSAVGLPALTKAQDKAKDSAALATLTNAAKECSLAIITGDAAEFLNLAEDAPSNPRFAAVDITAEGVVTTNVGCVPEGALEITTEGTKDAAGAFRTGRVEFIGGVPGTAVFTADAG